MKPKPPMYLWVSQYGVRIRARTRTELVKRVIESHGGGRVSIMYADKADGRTVRCGYVIGQHWFTQFAPVETPA